MKKFVNRKSDTKKLEVLCKNIKGRKTLVLHSETCIGKSTLTNKFLSKYYHAPAIKVEIKKKDLFTPGFFLFKICEAIGTTINNIDFPFEKKDIEKSEILKKTPSIIIMSILQASTPGRTLNEIYKNFNIAKGEAEKILLEYENEKNVSIIERAIQNILSEYPFVLNIENIQLIDTVSEKALLRILNNCKNFILILEYTYNNEYQLSDIVDMFRDNINENDIFLEEIVKLEEIHLLETLEDNEKYLSKEIQKKIDNGWNGNIKDIRDFVYKKTLNMNINISLIQSLNEEELFWLGVIVYDGTGIRERVLLDNGCRLNILRSLKDKELVILSNDSYLSDHDIIFDQLSTLESFSKIKLSVHSFLKKFYLNKFYINNDFNNFFRSMEFSIMVEDEKTILYLIKKGKTFLTASSEPQKYTKKIEGMIIKKFVNNTNSTLYYWLIELYQNIGDCRNAFRVLETYSDICSSNSKKTAALKALLLYQNGHHQTAINFCDSMLKIYTDDESVLNYKLIHMESLYALGKVYEAHIDYCFIQKNKKRFNGLFEFGFFLRNSELFIQRYEEIIICLEKSIIQFAKFKAEKQENSSRNTLAIHYSLVGENEKAENELNRIIKNNNKFLGLENMIYNNLAVVKMFKHETKNITEYLLIAKHYAQSDYAHLAINNNLLAFYNMSNINSPTLIDEINIIIEDHSFASIRIIQFCYINIMFYFKNIVHNQEEYNKYYEKLISIGDLPKYMRKWIDGEVLSNDDPDFFRASLQCPLNFLSDWSIEFDSHLMHFE